MPIHKKIASKWKGLYSGPLKSVANIFTGEKNRQQAKKQFRQNMDESIQRRVADAKKAGIHPLFALGGSLGASPTFMAGQSPLGGAAASVARAAVIGGGKKLLGIGKSLEQAQVRAMNASASRDEAAAAATLSETARRAGGYNVTQDSMAFPSPGAISTQGWKSVPQGYVTPKAPEQFSTKPGDPSVQAGSNAAFMEIDIGLKGDGSRRKVWIGRTDEGPFEDVGPVNAIMSVLKNVGAFNAKGSMDPAIVRFLRQLGMKVYKRKPMLKGGSVLKYRKNEPVYKRKLRSR